MADINAVQPRIPLGRKVRAGLGALLALLALLVGVAIFLVVNLTAVEDDVPYTTAIAAASLDAKSVANDQRGFLLTGDPMYLREADERVADARQDFAAAARAAVTDEQRRAASDSSAGFELWWTAAQAEFATYQVGDKQSAIAASVGPDRALRKHYEESLSRTRSLGQSSLQSATSRLPGTAVVSLIGCLVAALVAGAVIAYWLLRQISLPIFKLAAMLTADPL